MSPLILKVTIQSLVSTGLMIGLAPPANAAAPDINALSVFTRLLYDNADDDDRFDLRPFPGDIGLRWLSERWSDAYTD